MHISPEAELFPLDTELEKTRRNLKKVRVTGAVGMPYKEGTHQHAPTEETT